MYEVFIVCMIILVLVHMRRASDYTWCKVDRCESDGSTINWKNKSCTESDNSPTTDKIEVTEKDAAAHAYKIALKNYSCQ